MPCRRPPPRLQWSVAFSSIDCMLAARSSTTNCGPEAGMRYRLLGQTGLYVSELCLGTMTYGGGGAGIWASIGKLQQDAVNEQLRTAVDAGINFIDTANVYSLGQSETLLGQSLKSLALPRDQLIIATKA